MQKLSLVAVASFLLVATGAQNAAAAPLGDTAQTIQPAIASLLKTIKDPERRQEIHAATPVLTSVLNDMACTPSIPGPISSNHHFFVDLAGCLGFQASLDLSRPLEGLPLGVKCGGKRWVASSAHLGAPELAALEYGCHELPQRLGIT